MKKKKMSILAIVLAGCCALGGCGTQNAGETAQEEQGNYVTGTVECKEVYVRAKIPGYLTNIPIEEGQEVQEGDLLFSTDERDVKVKQTQASATAKAAAGQAEAAAGQAAAAAGQAEAAAKAIQAAESLVEKANANVKLLETEYAKYQELFAMDAVSQDNMDKLATQLEAARKDAQAALSQKQAAEGQYQAATGQKQAAEGQYRAATGQLQAAQGVLAEVDLNLSQTSQYAPCHGTVTLISSSVGELIGTGTTIVTLTDYSDRWIMANVDEYEIGKLRIGQEVPLTSKAYPNQVFHGKIVNISKNPDFAIKKSTNELNDEDVITYEVKIALSEEDVMLYPGMLVRVDLDKVGDKK